MREKNNLLMVSIMALSVALFSVGDLMAYDWTIEVVDDSGSVGTYPSITLDSESNPHISYYDAGSDDLKLAALIDSVWNIEIVDSAGNVGKYSSIGIDSSGRKNISYLDESMRSLKYAGWIEPLFQWEYQIIDNCPTSGYRVYMLLNSAGYVELSYYNSNSDNLVHATKDSAGWQTQIIDSIGNVGQFSSFALDSADQKCWSYFDDDYRALKYAGRIEPLFNWDYEIVDNVPTSGYTIDMIFNLSGNVEMSYYDLNNGDLKHVVKDSAGWTAQVVDSAGNVGIYSSLAMDSSGNRGISYHDVALHQLKYAGRLVPKYDWIIEVVDDSGDVGLFPSITFDSLGLPAISYYDLGNGNLKFTLKDSVSWNYKVVDTTGDVGKYSSLILDLNEPKWAISYYDENDHDLKYAESTATVVPIPTLSEWGMLILALLLLAAATVAIVRKRERIKVKT